MGARAGKTSRNPTASDFSSDSPQGRSLKPRPGARKQAGPVQEVKFFGK